MYDGIYIQNVQVRVKYYNERVNDEVYSVVDDMSKRMG
jgi:hypothetical protein